MTDIYRENNRIYADSISLYPHDHRGVNWVSHESQFLRFKILCEIADGIFTSDILDVGCGMGHLVDYLLQNYFKGHYKGIDILDQMIKLAKERHETFSFEHATITDIKKRSHDYVLASGIFAFVDSEYTKRMITLLFERANQGLAVNCLNTMAKTKVPGVYYHHSEDLLAFCKTLTPKVTLRQDYLPNDFTLYLLR